MGERVVREPRILGPRARLGVGRRPVRRIEPSLVWILVEKRRKLHHHFAYEHTLRISSIDQPPPYSPLLPPPTTNTQKPDGPNMLTISATFFCQICTTTIVSPTPHIRDDASLETRHMNYTLNATWTTVKVSPCFKYYIMVKHSPR